MPVLAPLIDKRSYDDLVVDTQRLLQRYSSWRPPATGGEAGQALVHVFARLAELVVDRLNQVPDRNFLAFLDLVGLDLLPPQAARVPVTFQLAAGSTVDALVPARTRIAAILAEGETEPVIFETEQELVVTRSQLVAAFTRQPDRDRYSDHTLIATGQAEGAFLVFQGDQPIEHRLYLGHSRLFAMDVAKKIVLHIESVPGDEPWLHAVEWAYWDGAELQPLAADDLDREEGGGWTITLSHVPAIPVATRGGEESAWLCGRLTTSLPRGELIEVNEGQAQFEMRQQGLAPDAGLASNADPADATPLDFSRTFYPFGEATARTTFYLACDAAFSKPGAAVDIIVDLDATRPARPSPDLDLTWEYWDGTEWQMLGSEHNFNDKTQAFAADGVISFDCPPDWVEGREDVETGFWLRARIAAGSYGPAADYRPPVVQGLTLSYTWPVPRIDTIRTSVTITADDLVPDWAFGNQTPLDPSKDFLPFGEKPKVGDTLYLADDEAFSKPGAKLTLTVKLTYLLEDKNQPKLIWEFWDKERKRWEPFGESGPGVGQAPKLNQTYHFSDGTNAFRAEGVVEFTCPPIGPREVNGQLGHWIRVRLAAGDYGVEARYEPVLGADGKPRIDRDTGLPVYQLVPATFQPPSIQSIAIGYNHTSNRETLDYTLAENDFAIEDQSQAAKAPGQPFNPYWPTDDTRPTFYLGFQRPGSDVGFANRSTQLYCSVAEVAYERSLAEGRAGDEPAAVVWQYWNGERWARLGTRDQTQSFTERGLVTFIGPPDFRRSSEFGAEAFWLQAGWERGAYAAPPQLRRVLTNTIWAAHTLTVQNEVLGSSNGEPDQVFRSTQAPLLAGQRIEVREPEMPSAAERATLEAEEGEEAIATRLDPSGRPEAIWVRWHQVPDFYASGPRSRHYTLDRLTGEVRFGNGQQGMVPPRGRANLRVAWYQTGGGLRGNRPAGAVAQLKSAVPYVDGATNWEPAAGGSAQETLEAVKDRGPKTLRHRDRAVAIEDFEDLAHQASPAVARVKGIPARDSHDAGSVGLIVVPRSEEAQPIPSLELLDRVEDYIQARLAPTVDLWVAGPDWLRVTISAEIVPVSLEAVSDVLTDVLARLATFLHPLTGGLDGGGWAFGRKPYRSDLYALIESAPGVDHVRQLMVTEEAEEGAARPERFLVYSGDHQITMVGGTD